MGKEITQPILTLNLEQDSLFIIASRRTSSCHCEERSDKAIYDLERRTK